MAVNVFEDTSICAPSGSDRSLEFATQFVSHPPRVRLINATAEPLNNAMATARTCYASRIITPEDVRKDDKAVALRDRIAQSTYEAGHHTTLQHATFQFIIEGVSRQCLWSFLHAHPFYNSEQVSQRYVRVAQDKVLVPRLPPKAQDLYEATVAMQMRAYQDLVALLFEPAADAYFSIFRGRRKHFDQYKGAIQKKAQEVARYVLPVATHAHLYHTVSGLTLHRYHRLQHLMDVPCETRALVMGMIDCVNEHDPLFFRKIEDAIPLQQTHEYQLLAMQGLLQNNPNAKKFCSSFDTKLAGKRAILLDYSPNAEATLAESVRITLGLCRSELSDEKAIESVLNPACNPYLAQSLNLTSLGKTSRALFHPHYTFAKKLSHTADSQNQRHRLTPGTRPILQTHYVPHEPDVVVPDLVARHPKAYALFNDVVAQTWKAIDSVVAAGVTYEMALYLLPNAVAIRFLESGDLLGLHHKWVSRLCYNAQEEIWRASMDEVEAVTAAHPQIGRHILPPCGIRAEARVRPTCPEGPRFCGVPVWKLSRREYERII